VALREAALGEAHPLVAESLERLADLELGSGADAAALEHALRAEEISRRHLRATARFLPEAQALLFAAERPSGLPIVLRHAARGDAAAAAAAWDALIRSRAVILDEMASRRRALADRGDAFSSTLEDQWRSASARHAALVLRGPGALAPATFREVVAAAREERERAERALAARSERLRRLLAEEELGWSAVRAALPAGSALVAYARFDPAAKPGRLLPRESSYLAFVAVGGAGAPVAIPLGPAAEIDGRVSRWRDEIVAGRGVPGRSREAADAAQRAAAREVAAAVWRPIAARVAGAARVFIVPDGALHRVSFAALPDDPGPFLIDTAALHYLSTERELAAPPSGAIASGIVAIGAPDFDLASAPAATASGTAPRGAISSCDGFVERRFETLPAARGEVDDVVDLWRRRAPREASLVRLTGAEATEAAFKREAERRGALHVATHGFFLGGECGDGLESPLLRSGLVLSGANRRMGADDGVVTAQEIAALDLDGLGWAVVSGCDSGVGAIQAGEGILGLRRAFRTAGARALVLSLWPVEDEATRRFMRALYEARFVHEMAVPEAMRRAQQTMQAAERRAGRAPDPAGWGAFVAAGDWR
jgi:CHAT domain-containing protein